MPPKSAARVDQDWGMFNDPMRVAYDKNKCLNLLDKAIEERVQTLWSKQAYKGAFPAGTRKPDIVATLEGYEDEDLKRLIAKVTAITEQNSFRRLVYETKVLSKLRDHVSANRVKDAIFAEPETLALGRLNISVDVLLDKIREASNQSSGFAILEACVIEEVQPPPLPRTDSGGEDAHGYEEMEPPHFPFILKNYEPDTVQSTHGDSSLKPRGPIRLEAWPKFHQSFNKFFDDKDNANLIKLYPTLAKRRPVNLVKEADVTYVLRTALSDTILVFYEDDRIELTPEDTLIFGRPDFCLKREEDGLVYITIECKHPNTRQPRTRREIIETFMQQFVSQTTMERARPVNQLVNYLVENSVKRGILTCLQGSVALEMEVKDGNKVIRVSDMVVSEEILKLVAFLLDRALKDQNLGNPPRRQKPKSSNPTDEDDEFIPPSSESRFLPDQGGPSLNFNAARECRNIHGKYTESADTFKAIDHQTLHQHFKEWKLDIPSDKTIIGRGRTGLVCLASVYHVDTPNIRYSVAVKCGDFMKIHSLKRELQNEARVIKYANNLGLKCVPQLHYSGYFGFGGVMYMNCTRYIDGYTKDLNQLNAREQYLLKSALAELRMANILHNDIKKSNILFTSSQCFILDYGASKIIQQDILHDRLEFDPNDSGVFDKKSTT